MAALIIVSGANPDFTVRQDFPAEERTVSRAVKLFEGNQIEVGDLLEDATSITVTTTIGDYAGSFWADVDAMLLAARTADSLTIDGNTINVHGLKRVRRESHAGHMHFTLVFLKSSVGVAMPAGWDVFPTDPTITTLLGIHDAVHQHFADNMVLVGAQALIIQDGTHAHTADNCDVAAATLVIQDATHAHAADNVALVVNTVLVIADATHAHTADNVVLFTGELIIQDSTHAHSADQCNVTTDFEFSDIASYAGEWDSSVGLFEDTAGVTAATDAGDPVRRWEDQSSNNNHVTQDNSTSPPGTSNTGNPTREVVNGRPVVRFTLTQLLWRSNAGPIPNTGAATIVAVIKRATGSTSDDEGIASWANGSGNGEDFALTSEIGVRVNGGNELWDNNDLSNSSFETVVWRRPASANVSQVTLRIDGSDITRTGGTSRTLANSGTPDIVLGEAPRATVAKNGQLDAALFVVFTGNLTGTDLTNVETKANAIRDDANS